MYYHNNNINNIKIEFSNEFKKINFKNRTCHYFDDITSINGLDYDNFYYIKNYMKIF